MTPHLVQVNEPMSVRSIPTYSTTSLSTNVDDGVVIIVPTLPENRVASSNYLRPGTTFNGDFDKSTGKLL